MVPQLVDLFYKTVQTERKMPKSDCLWYSLISQLVPVHPGLQVHVYPLMPSWHWPFTHGPLEHSLISTVMKKQWLSYRARANNRLEVKTGLFKLSLGSSPKDRLCCTWSFISIGVSEKALRGQIPGEGENRMGPAREVLTSKNLFELHLTQ